MKKLSFAAFALALSVSAASAAGLEGTYSGTVTQSNGAPFEQSYTVSKVTSNSALINGSNGKGSGSTTARRDGNRLTFGKATTRTLTINGNTATLTGRNVANGATLQGTLTKH